MLAHQRVATTEARYVEGGVRQAAQAQEIFRNLALEPIGKDINNNEYRLLREIYPNAEDKIIYKIMDMMKQYV